MYLHDLDRADKTATTMVPPEIVKNPDCKLSIKPGVVKWNPSGKNEKGRKSWYRERFECKTLEERYNIYNIKQCEASVKREFKANGWKVIGGEEYFERPSDQNELNKMLQVFRSVTSRYLTPPDIDRLVPLPVIDVIDDIDIDDE
jgi:hypothetical protein